MAVPEEATGRSVTCGSFLVRPRLQRSRPGRPSVHLRGRAVSKNRSYSETYGQTTARKASPCARPQDSRLRAMLLHEQPFSRRLKDAWSEAQVDPDGAVHWRRSIYMAHACWFDTSRDGGTGRGDVVGIAGHHAPARAGRTQSCCPTMILVLETRRSHDLVRRPTRSRSRLGEGTCEVVFTDNGTPGLSSTAPCQGCG